MAYDFTFGNLLQTLMPPRTNPRIDRVPLNLESQISRRCTVCVSGAVRLGRIEAVGELPLVRQCELAGVSRATVYRPRAVVLPDDDDLVLCALIDEEFTRHPFYGSRRMVVILKRQGWLVNRKYVQRLMRILGLAGMAPGPGTPVQHPGHKVYPYLLRGVVIVRPNHVWSTDITYILPNIHRKIFE